MNRFYEVLGGRGQQRKLDLYIGDEKLSVGIGCFEVLLVIDSGDRIEKLECNFLLDCPQSALLEDVNHPSLIYITLSTDLLYRKRLYNSSILCDRNPYRHYMYITKESTIDDVSRFTPRLNGEPAYTTHSSFVEALELIKVEIGRYQDKRTECEGIYETISLPEIAKFRCRKFRMAQGRIDGIRKQGWYFSFHTTVPEVLKYISYNNFNNCKIKQLHGG